MKTTKAYNEDIIILIAHLNYELIFISSIQLFACYEKKASELSDACKCLLGQGLIWPYSYKQCGLTGIRTVSNSYPLNSE